MSGATAEDTTHLVRGEVEVVPSAPSVLGTAIAAVPSASLMPTDDTTGNTFGPIDEAMKKGAALVSKAAFAEAAHQFEIVAQYLQELLSTGSDEFQADNAIQQEAELQVRAGIDFARGFHHYCLGMLAQQNGDSVNAALYLFASARLLQERFAEVTEIRMTAIMATAIAMTAEAQTLLRQGKRTAAEQKNNDVITFVYSEVMPHRHEIDPSMVGAFLALLGLTHIGKSISAMISSIVGADYDSALSYAAEIGKRIDEIRGAAEEIELTEQIRVNLEKIMLALASQTNGLEAIAFAGQAAKRRDWAAFDRQTSTAKARLRDTQRTYLEVKELAPRTEAIELTIEMLVEPMCRHVSEQRRLYEQIDEWKQWYRDLAGKAGVTVTTVATADSAVDVSNELKNTVEVSTNIANYFQDRATAQLLGLQGALLTIPGDNADRDELLKKLEGLLALPKGDSSWLGNVKKFSGDAAKIVGNLAKIASPVATAWNLLAPLFGVPPLPLPTK